MHGPVHAHCDVNIVIVLYSEKILQNFFSSRQLHAFLKKNKNRYSLPIYCYTLLYKTWPEEIWNLNVLDSTK